MSKALLLLHGTFLIIVEEDSAKKSHLSHTDIREPVSNSSQAFEDTDPGEERKLNNKESRVLRPW